MGVDVGMSWLRMFSEDLIDVDLQDIGLAARVIRLPASVTRCTASGRQVSD